MKILGIDPGFANLGVALIELLPSSTRALHVEAIETRTSSGADEARLDDIAERLLGLIDYRAPDAIGYENQAGVEAAAHRRRQDAETDVWSTASSRRVHEVAGIIRCAARCYELPCYCLAPNSVKVAILGKGGGRAKKDAMRARARVIFGIDRGEHIADALAVALGTGVRHRIHVATLARHAALIR